MPQAPVRVRRRVSTGAVLLAAITTLFLGCTLENQNYQVSGEDVILEMNSPLDEFRAIIQGSPWEDVSLPDEQRIYQFDSAMVRKENLIAQCMLDSGFDYTPSPESYQLELLDIESWNPNERDWVVQYGYGILAINLKRPGVMQSALPSEFEAYQTLSESEIEAWRRAFYGNIPIDATLTGDFSLISEMRKNPTRENAGCRGWAEAEIALTPENRQEFAEFTPLFEALSEMAYQLAQSISDADRDWAACMANAGFPNFDRQRDAEQTFSNQVSDFFTAWNYETDGPDPTNTPQMHTFREKEIELALADLDCRSETNFDQRQQAHRIAVETQFVNDNLPMLQALRSTIEQL